MDANLSPVLIAALSAYGLTGEAIRQNPANFCIGKFAMAGDFAAAAAAGTQDTVRRLDPRFSQFQNGWLVVIAWEHRLAGVIDTTVTAMTPAEAADIIAATSLVWTPSGASAPVFRPLLEALGGSPLGLRQIELASAAAGSFFSVGPTAGPNDPSRAIPADVIDLQNDTLQYQYGVAATATGGSEAPGAAGAGFSITSLAVGFLVERGAIPGRPTGPCDADGISKAVGTAVTQAMVK